MTTIITSYQQALDLLREAIATRGGGYVYRTTEGSSGCHYRWDLSDIEYGEHSLEEVGQAACVIGVLADKCGVLDDLFPLDDVGGGEGYFVSNGDAFGDTRFMDLVVGIDDEVERSKVHRLFSVMQARQDTGNQTWDQALAAALEAVELMLQEGSP